MVEFAVAVLTPAGHPDPALAIAACRAGAVGILNQEGCRSPEAVEAGVTALIRHARAPFGLKISAEVPVLERLAEWGQGGLAWLVLDLDRCEDLLEHLAVAAFRRQGGRLWVELTGVPANLGQLEDRVDGWWVKGHEAGGVVGEETSFILLQRLVDQTRHPVLVRGGVGMHTAPACRVGGAAGVVLDSQMLLLRESPLASVLTPALRGLAGNETVLLGDEERGRYLRVLERPGYGSVDLARQALREGGVLAKLLADWVRWTEPESGLLPVGQDVAFAAPWAERYGSVANVVRALRQTLETHPREAAAAGAMAEAGPLATSHGTRFPIVQGAMTRVSDVPGFAAAVAEAGALPMIALAMLRGEQSLPILEQTARLLGERPWGVGILGFVPADLRAEQLAAIRAVRPRFAYIAGGRPDQAAALEAEGIHTYLHVPTPALLRLFHEQGARRFIFEGRECGGHIGPLSSLVLWESMVDALLEAGDLSDVAVLFAGGIHDGRSAAMVATLAAPLTQAGAQVGVLMGTAYLFTREAVEHGAITPLFQRVALACDHTATLTTGPGHASRCAVTPFVAAFHRTKRAMLNGAAARADVREALDDLTLGRLRAATKGLIREGETLQSLDERGQLEEGMYMIGQVAALHAQVGTLDALHREVSQGASARLQAWTVEPAADRGAALPKPADIAIIGIGTLVPGATEPSAFWQNIVTGVASITEVPADRWDPQLYFDPDPQVRDRIYSRWGGFLEDIPFDPTAYGMPPRSLKSIDPLQLLTLELVRRTLADADLRLEQVDRERIGVILGASGGMGDLGLAYATRADLPRTVGDPEPDALERLPEWTEDSFAGLLPNVAAGRATNRLDLGGVNCTVDAACASSLAAVYHGVNELLLGRSDVIVAGGVDTMQSPFAYLCFAKTRALSPRGRCRTFDQEADGIVIAEGLVAVVLKRLADAERDGDRIYAVIKGVGASSDGRAKGLTAPRPEGQIRALHRAYAEAGFSPATLGLVEAHGTGTVAGDRAELETVSRVMAETEAEPGSCAIGSVKTNIGHTKAAAGAAGLVKAALALYHRTVPPHLGINRPLALLSEPASPLFVSPQARPWVRHPDHPRRAGVSAFGFGGTDFHVALEEYDGNYRAWERTAPLQDWPVELFLWRAPSLAALTARLQALLDALRGGAEPRLADLAAALAEGLSEDGPTVAIVAGSHAALIERLAAALDKLAGGDAGAEGVYFAREPLGPTGRLALLFPGQGAQYPDMLRELAVAFPTLVEGLDRADALLAQSVGRRLSAFVFPPTRFDEAAHKAATAELTRTEIAQPALGALGGGLVRLCAALGLAPGMAAGHSYGEFVALHAAGALGFDDLVRLSAARGRFIVEEAAGADLGGMIAAQAERATLERLLGDLPGLTLANHNAPRQVVLSGTHAALDAAAARLEAQGIQFQRLAVAAGFHSPCVEPARQRLAAYLAGLELHPPRFAVYSNTTARPHGTDPQAIRAVLAEHLVRPVRFVEQVQAMYDDGARVFLELGPRSILSRLTRQILAERPHLSVAIEGQDRGVAGLLHALGALWAEQVSFDPRALFQGRRMMHLDLTRLNQREDPSALPAHVWLVNGGFVRRPGEPRQVGAQPFLTAGDRPPQRVTIEHLPEVVTMTHKSPTPPSGGVDEALTAYQETMRRFLQLQERVMTSYFASLNGESLVAQPLERVNGEEPAAPAPSEPRSESAPLAPVPTPRPEPARPPAPPAPEPVRDVKPVKAAPPKPAAEPADVTALLVQIASERTGYPADMLGLDQDIEADLGIDSIKRVEILGALRKALPAEAAAVLQSEMEAISGLRTFRAMAERIERNKGAAKPAEVAARPFEQAGAGSSCAVLPRYRIQAHPEPLPAGMARHELSPGAYLIVPDARGIGTALAERLRTDGVTPVLVPPELLADRQRLASWLDEQRGAGPVRAVVFLAPLGHEPWSDALDLAAWRDGIRSDIKDLFGLLQLTGTQLEQGGQLITASAMGGCQGRDYGVGAVPAFPAGAGLVGLVKTLSFEWNADLDAPQFRGKAIDLDPAEDVQALADHLHQELILPGGRREVGYPRGERVVFRTVPASLMPQPEPLRALGSDWVILATGGARGITAETLREFAPYRPTLVLVGRSPLPPQEPEATRGLRDPADLRRHFLDEARAAGEALRPAEVERRIQTLLQAREMRANLDDLQALGARIDYRSLDLREPAAVEVLIADLYATYGRIDAVLHGAGIIEDRLLEDKGPDSVDRVMDTKLDSAFLLARHLRPESLRFLAFFTSVAGRYGNRGQSDYAAANEVLNRLAWVLHSRWPQVKVVAVNWGPWDSTTHGAGMVTPEVRRQFQERGVDLVQAEPGRRFLLNELLYGELDAVELVAGDSPWEYVEARSGEISAAAPSDRVTDPRYVLLEGARLRAEAPSLWRIHKRVDLVSDPYLDHHRLDGVPVMPFVMVIEYLAEAASLVRPEAVVTELRDIQLTRGLRLAEEAVDMEIVLRANGDAALLAEVHWGRTAPVAAYRATVVLGTKLADPPSYAGSTPRTGRPLDVTATYRDWLFHGPIFQTITEISGLDRKGMIAGLRPSRPRELYPPARGEWLFDPALLDGVVQTVTIWSRAVNDKTTLPNRLSRIRRFGGRSPVGPLRCHLRLVSDPDDPNILCHLAVVDQDNRLWIQLEDLHCTSSTALNRIGGGWAGGAPAARAGGQDEA